MSRIGKKPVALPKGVTAEINGQTIEVKGPKGTRSFTATDDVTLSIEDGAVRLRPAVRDLHGRAVREGHAGVSVPSRAAISASPTTPRRIRVAAIERTQRW